MRKNTMQPTRQPGTDDAMPEGFDSVTNGGAPWRCTPGEAIRGDLLAREEIATKFGKAYRYAVRLSHGAILTLSDEDKGEDRRPVEPGETVTFLEKADTRCLSNYIGREVFVRAGEKIQIRDGKQTMQSFRVGVAKTPF